MELNGDDHFPAKDELPSSWEGSAPMKWQSDANDRKPSIQRTIFVTALVSLIVGALTTLTAFTVMPHRTSSPPVGFTAPLDNDNLAIPPDFPPSIPEDFVQEALAHVYQNGPPPSNSTRKLIKRQAPVMDDIKCDSHEKFDRRECDPDRGLAAWHDVCSDENGQYFAQAECGDADNLCADHFDGVPKANTVVCLAHIESTEIVLKEQHRASQYGYIHLGRNNNPGKKYTETVRVAIEMGAGSITAYLTDTKWRSIYSTTHPLTGHVRGKKRPYCKSAPDVPRACFPSQSRDLKAADAIDFTWSGMVFPSDAVLFYSLWGWNG